MTRTRTGIRTKLENTLWLSISKDYKTKVIRTRVTRVTRFIRTIIKNTL